MGTMFEKTIWIVDQNLLIAGWIFVYSERRFYEPVEYLIVGNRKLHSKKYMEELCK